MEINIPLLSTFVVLGIIALIIGIVLMSVVLYKTLTEKYEAIPLDIYQKEKITAAQDSIEETTGIYKEEIISPADTNIVGEPLSSAGGEVRISG